MANIHLLDSDLFKLNGKNLLEGDIVLSKDDLGLDKVDNTPDAEKVVASAETTITNAVVDDTPVTLEVAFEADGDGFVFG